MSLLGPHHPIIRQQAGKAVAQENNQVRHKLQNVARTLQRDFHKLMATPGIRDNDREAIASHRDALVDMRGRLRLYVETREALMPAVGSDGYVSELRGRARFLTGLLDKADKPDEGEGADDTATEV